MTTDTPHLLSTSQAARMLGVGVDRVRQLVRRGQLPSVVTPLGRLYDSTDVHRLAVVREQQSREQERARQIGGAAHG